MNIAIKWLGEIGRTIKTKTSKSQLISAAKVKVNGNLIWHGDLDITTQEGNIIRLSKNLDRPVLVYNNKDELEYMVEGKYQS